jgi:hypothetical protein
MQEITSNDSFGQALRKYTEGLDVGLEIGGGTGDGSTQCIRTKRLFSIENHPDRIGRHSMNLSARGGIAINGTATISSLWANKKDIEEFYQTIRTTLNQYPLEQVLGWHNVCLETAYQYKTSAIEDIHFEHNVDFNFVLIDGSPFSGESELRCVRPFLAEKAIIALDDVNDIKNYANYEKLKRTATLLWEDMACRNGAAIFQL